jgi:hypothetical protein
MDRLNRNNSVLFACAARILRVFAPVPIFIGLMYLLIILMQCIEELALRCVAMVSGDF